MRTLLLGEPLVDLICQQPAGALADAGAFTPQVGGSLASVAVRAARGGADVALAGAAGDDAWGVWLRDRLAAAGVALDWFSLVADSATPLVFTTVDAAGRPAYALHGAAVPQLDALAAQLPAAVEACGALVVTSSTMADDEERALTVAARDRALELGLPVVVDPNLRAHRWDTPASAASATRELVKGAFLVKCSAEEARLLTGEERAGAAADGLVAMGAQHAVVTDDTRGAVLRGGGMRADVPGRAAQVVSTVGAGDAFLAALLTQLAATDFYAPALAAGLAGAVEEAAGAVERWGALA